jgi:hypothetical protein
MGINDGNNSGYQKAAYIPPHLRGRAYVPEASSQNNNNYSNNNQTANNGWDKPAPRPG